MTMQMIRFLNAFKLRRQIPFFYGKLFQLTSWLERKYIYQVDFEKELPKRREIDRKIVVSLTSYPDRIGTVKYAVISLLRQTLKPYKMILWLSKEEFPRGEQELPEDLKQLKEHGLEIRWEEDNIRSHQKYYSVLQEFSDCLVATFDDDLIYAENILELLLKEYDKYPECIICLGGRRLLVNEHGFREYLDSPRILESTGPEKGIIPLTGFGTMYPPGCFAGLPEVFDKDLIRELAQNQDDLWICWMSVLAGKSIVKTGHLPLPSLVEAHQESFLGSKNWFGGNDRAIARLHGKFPQVRDLLVQMEAGKGK